jgi:hypothetical protein
MSIFSVLSASLTTRAMGLATARAAASIRLSVISVQRTSSDLKLNPHIHAVFLDGGYVDDQATQEDGMPRFVGLGHLQTREVVAVLEKTIQRMVKYLKRKKLLAEEHAQSTDTETQGHAELVALRILPDAPLLRTRQGRLRCRYSASSSEPLLCRAPLRRRDRRSHSVPAVCSHTRVLERACEAWTSNAHCA